MTSPPGGRTADADRSESEPMRRELIRGELKRRNLWFMRLRWLVPPAVIGGAILARLFGFVFAAGPVSGVGLFILAYNVGLWLIVRSPSPRVLALLPAERFTYIQASLDYVSMFLLIHFTGGPASPLIFFFIFHIIFASILLPRAKAAYGFSTLVAGGMAIIALLEGWGALPAHPVFFNGQAIDLAQQPVHVAVELLFFAASVYITAYFATSIMAVLRRRIFELAELSAALARANERHTALIKMVEAIGSIKVSGQTLDIITHELAMVMGIKAVSVKLLSDDRKLLTYAAGFGLPESLIANRAVEVDKSPLNKSVIEGKPFATGSLSRAQEFQFGENLCKAGIKSALFAPLNVEGRTIGVLGAYCAKPDRFGDEDIEFITLAAGLVAIAIDNARSYEAIETLMKERSWFMMKVAHNLRAPLAATSSMLEVLRDGMLGDFTPEQGEYLRRIERRTKTMLAMVSEFMALGTGRAKKREIHPAPIELDWLAGRIQRTFTAEAAEKEVAYSVTFPPGLPPINGDPDLIEQTLENLVSNAIKYTPRGGKVQVEFSRAAPGSITIAVSDNGIGIPRDAMPRLFTEFFRAPNARRVEESGTGLGLAIVKDVVEAHGGTVSVESEEGFGAIFVIHLPVVTGNEE